MAKTKTKTLQSIRDFLDDGVRMPDLTERQSAVLTYILECWASGFLPTVREIGTQMEISSPNGVVAHLRALRAKGYIEELGVKSAIMLADKALGVVL